MARYTTTVCLVLIAMLALATTTQAAGSRQLLQSTGNQARSQVSQLATQANIRNAAAGRKDTRNAAASGTSNVNNVARRASGTPLSSQAGH